MGRAPEYRGYAPAFWEMYHAEDSVGVTVHEVTAELDAGRILLQEAVPIDPAPGDDPLAYVEEYRSRVLEPAGVRLLVEAVASVARGEADPRPQDEERARYFGPPSRGDVWRLRARVARRRVRRRCADLAGRVVFGAGIHRRILADRAVVVLYHRVTDDATDNPLACTPEAFERHCEFYDRHFRVLALGDLLDRLRAGADVGRSLTVTFDDGYRDNYTVARPILERHDLPACFFLATGYVGSGQVPRWDAIRGEEPEWMSWDEVSDLLERGFEVGGIRGTTRISGPSGRRRPGGRCPRHRTTSPGTPASRLPSSAIPTAGGTRFRKPPDAAPRRPGSRAACPLSAAPCPRRPIRSGSHGSRSPTG